MPWGFDIAFVASTFMLFGYLGRPWLEQLAKCNILVKLGIAAGTPYLIRALVVSCITIIFSLFLMGLLSKYISEILGRPSTGKSYEKS